MVEIGFSLIAVAGYLLSSNLIGRTLRGIGERKNAAPKRATYISKVFNFGLAILVVFLLCLIWGIDYSSILFAASSTLAVIGIAFFAQWSILSNITASIVIFFSYPTRIGDKVRVLDTETSTIEGTIVDINLFQVLIQTDADDLVNYPNNLIIQKPVLKLAAKE